ncbi:uncharacterized protein LOC143040971 isoform X2 [Oratosquilla oratoria]|uniref:uncharacterized protein LOC143040971 isoform X2 n=2 Tax=Oratosquilla oratoria TaxID=337810 RepID=UPI003F776165
MTKLEISAEVNSMMASPDYPQPEILEDFENLDGHWLKECLSSYYQEEVEIKRWHGKKPETKQGYLSEIVNVEVDFVLGETETKKSLSLVFKLPPQTEKMKTLFKSTCAPQREFNLYTFVFSPGMKKIYEELGFEPHLPQFFYLRSESTSLTLVMKNFFADGFQISDGNDLELDLVKTYMRHLGTFHACGVIYKNREGEEVMEAMLNTPPVDLSFFEEDLKKGFEYLARLYEGRPQGRLLEEWAKRGKYILDLPWKHMTMKTCVHGDFWENNIVYNPSTQKVKIFDGQMSHFGNPIQDVAVFLIGSVQPPLLEKHLYEILGAYWDSYSTTVARGGVMVKETFGDLLETTKNLWMYGLFMVADSSEIFVSNGFCRNEDLMVIVDFFYEKGFLDLPCDDQIRNK